MRLGYGTYAMPEVPVWEALPRLRELGFEAVEICTAERWPTAPRKLDPSERARLRRLLADLCLELPALLLFVRLLAPAGEELAAQEALFRDACELAHDLSPDSAPAIVTPIGATELQWEEALPLALDRIASFGQLAADEGCRIALEPHVHGLFDRPERVLAVMEPLHSPSIGINLDISHFAVAGYPRAETIRQLAPYAFHTHVKDGRMEGGKVRFLLPGEGDFDYPAYFREMAAAGYDGCITAEVSVQIYDQPGYDPWHAAGFCFEKLAIARERAVTLT